MHLPTQTRDQQHLNLLLQKHKSTDYTHRQTHTKHIAA